MTLPEPTSPLRVVLYEPQIPPNTGNIARTCAAFQLPLALIEPLGFCIDDRSVRRAGLDYWPHVQLSTHSDLDHLLAQLTHPYRLIGCSRYGGDSLGDFQFQRGDVLLCKPRAHRPRIGSGFAHPLDHLRQRHRASEW